VGVAAVALAALALASPLGYLQSQQAADGGYGSPQATAWVLLAERTQGAADPTGEAYLRAHLDELEVPTDVALAALALGGPPELLDRLPRVGPTLNSTMWTILALRRGGRAIPPEATRALLAGQARSGGFAWAKGIEPDSNDTAAAIQALRAAGVRGRPLDRALAFLGRFRNRDGGFSLVRGRASDAQSTAWAIQAYRAAGKRPPQGAAAFLARLLQPDGSYRYSRQYATTPVWVTAQVLAAAKPF
jgi:prenyltransferase beta subunit